MGWTTASAPFGGENMKDVAGYDTKRLFIGSHKGAHVGTCVTKTAAPPP